MGGCVRCVRCVRCMANPNDHPTSTKLTWNISSIHHLLHPSIYAASQTVKWNTNIKSNFHFETIFPFSEFKFKWQIFGRFLPQWKKRKANNEWKATETEFENYWIRSSILLFLNGRDEHEKPQTNIPFWWCHINRIMIIHMEICSGILNSTLGGIRFLLFLLYFFARFFVVVVAFWQKRIRYLNGFACSVKVTKWLFHCDQSVRP